LLYELETTNNGTRFQERAWRKDGIGTYATIIAHERTKLLESGRNAVPIHMHIHRVVVALVIVVAENGTSLHVHTQTDYAVAHEIEMSDGTAFEQHRRLHLAADAHLCSRSHEDTAAKIGVAAHKAMSRYDGRPLNSDVMTNGGRRMYGHSILDFILFTKRLEETRNDFAKIVNNSPRLIVWDSFN